MSSRTNTASVPGTGRRLVALRPLVWAASGVVVTSLLAAATVPTAQAAAPHGMKTYTTPRTRTFDIPGGVTAVTVSVWGPGGPGGGGAAGGGGGGGGGGTFVKCHFLVKPESALSVIVGGASTVRPGPGSSPAVGGAKGKAKGTTITHGGTNGTDGHSSEKGGDPSFNSSIATRLPSSGVLGADGYAIAPGGSLGKGAPGAPGGQHGEGGYNGEYSNGAPGDGGRPPGQGPAGAGGAATVEYVRCKGLFIEGVDGTAGSPGQPGEPGDLGGQGRDGGYGGLAFNPGKGGKGGHGAVGAHNKLYGHGGDGGRGGYGATAVAAKADSPSTASPPGTDTPAPPAARAATEPSSSPGERHRRPRRSTFTCVVDHDLAGVEHGAPPPGGITRPRHLRGQERDLLAGTRTQRHRLTS
ncbi:hypothetical protein ACH4PU_35515 [Streptomyces sp. NPDC021100]|uniref:hypothetical protein n=1 Tax=Streptomyces sp. NPDC021100 TaxID=3365114 RepID=UPI00379E495E